MTFSLKSIGRFDIPGRGTVFSIESPVACPRDDILKAIGSPIVIDGIVVIPKSIEIFMRSAPITIGEPIGVCAGRYISELLSEGTKNDA